MKANTEADFRMPTADEIILLRFAAKAPRHDNEVYEQQVSDALVRYSCHCGCPTFELQLGQGAPTTDQRYEVADIGVAKYEGEPVPCWAIAFIKDGRVSEVEIAGMADPPVRGAKLLELATSNGDILYSAEEAA